MDAPPLACGTASETSNAACYLPIETPSTDSVMRAICYIAMRIYCRRRAFTFATSFTLKVRLYKLTLLQVMVDHSMCVFGGLNLQHGFNRDLFCLSYNTSVTSNSDEPPMPDQVRIRRT